MSSIAQVAWSLVLRSKPDAELLSHALRGDALAFSEVYRRYEPRIHGYCMARLLSSDSAQDAAQEVFIRLLAAEPDSVDSLGPWLYGVARHVCVDVARRANARELPTDSPESADEAASSPSVEEQVLSRGEAANIMLALRRMRPRYRTALVMREIHRLPMSEIAESLGVNEGAAYTVISRARDAFGKTYAEVLSLPPACATAVEAMYRKTGTGISSTEEARLAQHLSECATCSREASRAENRSGMCALVPFLPGLAPRGRGLVAQAMMRLGETAPAMASASHYAPLIEPATMKFASVALIGSLALFSGAAAVQNVSAQRTQQWRNETRTQAAETTLYGDSIASNGTVGPVTSRTAATARRDGEVSITNGSPGSGTRGTASTVGHAAEQTGNGESGSPRRPHTTAPGTSLPHGGGASPGQGTPSPDPNPDPASPGEGAPSPAPSPTPKPAPDPGPKPAPEPAPSPGPKPAPEPAPSPGPKPAPEPAPSPGPGHSGTSL